MAHFAKIDENNIVVEVIVAEQGFIDSGAVGDPAQWVQTSYNTRAGVHYSPETGEPDDGVALRKNYAGIGFNYDNTRDAFIPPQPYASWTLNEDECQWHAPEALPDPEFNEDGTLKFRYYWDEESYSSGSGGWKTIDPN